jgi:hypothetical protein
LSESGSHLEALVRCVVCGAIAKEEAMFRYQDFIIVRKYYEAHISGAKLEMESNQLLDSILNLMQAQPRSCSQVACTGDLGEIVHHIRKRINRF